jgi:hypothetical protein
LNSHHVFISHVTADREKASAIAEQLEQCGFRCWIAPRDIVAGESFGERIQAAIRESQVVVFLCSTNAAQFSSIIRESQIAFASGAIRLAFLLDRSPQAVGLFQLLNVPKSVDGSGGQFQTGLLALISALRQILPETGREKTELPDEVPEASPKARGYVFVSYVRADADFVLKLRSVLKEKSYGYWDYMEGDRDYHGALYRELEERIDGAVAFMSIVSDDWRCSDWVASEFIYAREASIPIFVIQAKRLSRPLPILLNLQTRIDMANDFELGCHTLIHELSKKGL